MINRYILLVEDNQDDIELMMRALKANNITNKIIVAEDGEQALDYLMGKSKGPEVCKKLPAVILLDLKLPKIAGLEVLKEIRENEKTKRVPVVILTSSKEQEDVVKSYELGCNSYVRKPVDFEKFSEAVRQLGLYWLLMNELPEDAGGG